MKKNLIYFATILLVVLVLAFLYMKEDKELTKDSGTDVEIELKNEFNSLQFNSIDSLSIYADLYEIADKNAPIIILFHQARYSRGEYRTIAPKLNELGFTCLAIDQRSGEAVHGITNETHAEAIEKGKAVTYPDAYPDLEASLEYVKQHFPNKKIIVWGSSYSAALSFILTQKNRDDITAVIAFSPGNYFEFEGKKITDFAKEVTCPVFITSAGDEQEYWKSIYENLPSTSKQYYLPETPGRHGSSALLETTEGYEMYWAALQKFLSSIKTN